MLPEADCGRKQLWRAFPQTLMRDVPATQYNIKNTQEGIRQVHQVVRKL